MVLSNERFTGDSSGGGNHCARTSHRDDLELVDGNAAELLQRLEVGLAVGDKRSTPETERRQ